MVGLATTPQQLMYKSVNAEKIVLRNYVSAVDVPLPLLPSKEERIQAVASATAKLKESLQPQILAIMVPMMMKMIGAKNLVKMLEGSKDKAPDRICVITNVPGPQR